MGANVRVGLEDNLFIGKGKLATSNAELVAKMRHILEELSIDTKGHVKISGGWIDVPKQLALDLYGFRLEITKVGFGKADDGRNWIGLNGGLRLMEGIPAGASVEGLRVLWDDDGNNISLTMNGIGVELEIPGTLKLAGKVALNGKEFSGAVKVDLPAVGMQLEGQFVAGTLPTGEKTFAIFLQMQLPAGIPLGPTGLGIYGFAGLFAHNREPDKLDTEGWYRNPDFSDGWFTRTPAGVAQLSKWRGAPGHLGLGAGVVLGTMSDNGYMFNGRLLLVLVFPGPVILLEGMANLFTQRASLGSAEPNFHALVVIEPGKSFLAGLDAHYKYKAKGELFDIRGSAEAFFENASNWHIYMGIKDPKERRIRARIFDLFDVNGFFMLTPGQLDIGSGWSYSKNFGFGKLGVGLSASMDQEATISWHPNHFTGSVAVEGRADLHAYGFSTGLSVGATVKGDVFDPFALKGDFKVGINLPWPLPDISKTVTLEWKHDFTTPPALPVPAREASIEHIKSRNTWPLERGKSLLADDGAGGAFAFERPGNQPPGSFPQLTPPFSAGQQVPRVPADTKVALTFTRPINDPNFNERAEILREKGTDRSRFFRGEIDKYTWVDVGSSYLPSDLLAAFLRAQLEHRDRIQSMRRQIWEIYHRELASWAKTNGVRLPIVPAECEQSYHMFYVIMPSFESRQALISHLAGFGILAVFHYLPLHLSPMGLRFGGRRGDCPVTEDLADRLLRLPFFTGMSSSEQSQIIDAVRGFHC